jgi:hypothetical protein
VNPFAGISNFFKAVGAFFGWAQQRDSEENSPEMRANAQAATDAKVAADASRTVADAGKGDPDAMEKLRKEAAE